MTFRPERHLNHLRFHFFCSLFCCIKNTEYIWTGSGARELGSTLELPLELDWHVFKSAASITLICCKKLNGSQFIPYWKLKGLLYQLYFTVCQFDVKFCFLLLSRQKAHESQLWKCDALSWTHWDTSFIDHAILLSNKAEHLYLRLNSYFTRQKK